ncbi:MAG: tRNA 2-selenouridine(34) synthase MnmH [Brevirhabdus sp.]
MAIKLKTLSDLQALPFDAVIDVRSPSEYAEDHIPGAINLPVLDDAQRAEVGTIYKRVSPFKARKVGAALVSQNAARHLQGPLADHDGSWRPLVYCWRGGQRSNSFASILQQIGWRAEVIDGGYRSYRRMVSAMMHETTLPHRVILIDGNTGTAKTAILHALAARGHQVVDLEGLAAHRGSIFGDMGTGQPSQKAYESAVAGDLNRFDPARPVLVEAESSKVGRLIVPPSLWAAMQAAPRIAIEAPMDARAAHLTLAYRDLAENNARLVAGIEGLRTFHPAERIEAWLIQAHTGQFTELATALMQHHYDPRYAKSTARAGQEPATTVSFDALDESGIAHGLPTLEAAIAQLSQAANPVLR